MFWAADLAGGGARDGGRGGDGGGSFGVVVTVVEALG